MLRSSLILLLLFSITAFGQDVAQLEAELKKHPQNMRTRYELANLYGKENLPDKVIELLNPYTDQLNSSGFMLLASSYSSKKAYADEVRVLSILAAQDEENYQWHMLLGEAYLKQANAPDSDRHSQKHTDTLTAGIQQLRRALQLNKKFKPAFDLLLNTFLSQHGNSEARDLLLDGLDVFGRRPEFFHELCRLDANDGFLDQAVEACRESIKASPNFPDQYVYLTQTLHDQQEDVQAERTIMNAAKHFPQSEFVQWAAGTLFFRKKNFPVAARYFQAAILADPKEGRSQFGLAQSLFESGKEKEALEHFIAACKIDHSSLDTFLAAGGRLTQKGQSELGAKYKQAANTCSP